MSETSGFNATDRQEKRENKKVTIGDREFRVRKRSNSRLRAFRRLGRRDDGLRREQQDLERKVNRLDPAWIAQRVDYLAIALSGGEDDLPGAVIRELTNEFEDLTQRLRVFDDDETAKEKIAERETLQDQADELEDERVDLIYEMVGALLKPVGADAPDEVDVEWLSEELDYDDAQDLLDFAAPSDGEADPTTTPQSEPSSA